MRTRVPIAICVLLATGCGRDNSPKGVTEDLADAICDLAFGCCTAGELAFTLGPFVTEEDCADRITNSASLAPGLILSLPAFAGVTIELPNLAILENAIDEGRTRVNGDAVDACVEFLRALPCNAVAGDPPEGCVAPEPPLESPCDLELMFEGQIGDGGTCSSPGFNVECKPGLACRQNGAVGAIGACVEPGSVGDFCFFDAECFDELYCRLLDGTCDVPRLEGESCEYADPDDPAPPPNTQLIACDTLLGCDPVTDTCVAACEQGAGCFFDGQCDEEQNLQCILGRCDVPRPEGQACSQPDDCQAGLRCAFDPAAGELQCLPLLGNGQPCGFNDASCASGFCDTTTNLCAATLAPGGLCTTASDSQCGNGYCETAIITCATDPECTASGTCNIAAGRCEFFCLADLADGATCDRGSQCASDTCVFDNLGAGICRTPPLADGVQCSFDAQCLSEFCGVGFPRVCSTLPLANGVACNQAAQCSSGICDFANGLCTAGLPAGSNCVPFGAPCARDLYCDPDGEPPICTQVRDAGELCQDNVQCRGACVIRFNRPVCDSTPTRDAAVCDGT